MRFKINRSVILLALAVPGLACGDDAVGNGSGGGEVEVPHHYQFESRFEAGTSSVGYSGQVFRHALILGLTSHLGALTGRIDDGDLVPAAGDVFAELDFFLRFDSATAGDLPLGIETSPPALQVTWNQISSNKDLIGKLAGNDEVGQHVDWSEGISGWAGNPTPEGLVEEWFSAVDALAVDRAAGTIPMDPDGKPIAAVHVSATGLDYRQLTQKFLLGAVAFSQGTDDYLDDDIEGKGLLSDNSEAEAEDGKEEPFTALEHGWDEGFGYFGAARDYLDYTDDEIAAKDGRPEFASGYHDTDEDGAIDLTRELNFGHSQNAGKRDRGSSPDAPTDFTGQAMDAFLTGRAIIAAADGDLTDEQMADLQAQRDLAVAAWEGAIAATVVHYINETLVDMNAFGTDDYAFLEHAEHWSELKGFALSFQFNPRSPLSDADFTRLHDLIGDAPVLPGDDGIDAYRAALVEARGILGAAHGFDAANLGDEDGAGGW